MEGLAVGEEEQAVSGNDTQVCTLSRGLACGVHHPGNSAHALMQMPKMDRREVQRTTTGGMTFLMKKCHRKRPGGRGKFSSPR